MAEAPERAKVILTGYSSDTSEGTENDTVDKSATNENATIDSPRGSSENKNKDSRISNISKFDGNTCKKDATSHVETIENSEVSAKVVEEEIVELEFQVVKPKLVTHSIHCPNCKSEVTKVVIHRKVHEPQIDPQRDSDDLVGCLTCFSLFTFTGNGSLNPFYIFPKKPTVGGTAPVVPENDYCLSMSLVLKKKQKVTDIEDPPKSDPVNVDRDSTTNSNQSEAPKYDTGSPPIAKGEYIPPPPSIVKGKESKVVVDAPVKRRSWFGFEGLLAEILKSIVYGGLMEVIAMLSVVASAASSETATLNIIVLALASLYGGVIVIWHNLWDLRDDCYKENPSQQTEGEAINKYKELFGRINYFPLHAFFAILSFLIFGMIPPVTYGFSFYKTNDTDFSMLAVAIASLLCVALLAIFKAFINECGALEYFKTVSYYVTTAVSASGVSYVAGNLVTRLVKVLGFFDTSLVDGMSVLQHVNTTSLTSF